MAKYLVGQEVREIKASQNFRMFSKCRDHQFKVIADREDCETPYVHLKDGDHMITMTDTAARDLIDRLQRALAVLPTSK
ncbi:hypothetical protein CPT_Maja_087 [Burkholderia phage Maja]|uniref:Uncharacterized protein n=1 Tax=Burkholderia phage Maja TaxID=2767571 RepID=A0A7S6R8C1_9CAUD|nr:hypothetical protein CPT_Maja_087 [Burkholderia phage Maja]